MTTQQTIRRTGTTAAMIVSLTLATAAGPGAARAAGTPASQPAGSGAPTSRPAAGANASQPAGATMAAPIKPAPVRPIRRQATPVRKVTLRAFHRVFHEFVDDNTVGPYAPFPIGDTEYTAEVVEFVPDFALNLKTREVFSRSERPDNPALRILVKKQGVAQDTVWAMLNMPPHFARKSLLAFQIRRLELKDHAPIMAIDPAPTAPGEPKLPVSRKVGGVKAP